MCFSMAIRVVGYHQTHFQSIIGSVVKSYTRVQKWDFFFPFLFNCTNLGSFWHFIIQNSSWSILPILCIFHVLIIFHQTLICIFPQKQRIFKRLNYFPKIMGLMTLVILGFNPIPLIPVWWPDRFLSHWPTWVCVKALRLQYVLAVCGDYLCMGKASKDKTKGIKPLGAITV